MRERERDVGFAVRETERDWGFLVMRSHVSSGFSQRHTVRDTTPFRVAFGGIPEQNVRPKNTHWGKKRSAITLHYSFSFSLASSFDRKCKRARARQRWRWD